MWPTFKASSTIRGTVDPARRKPIITTTRRVRWYLFLRWDLSDTFRELWVYIATTRRQSAAWMVTVLTMNSATAADDATRLHRLKIDIQSTLLNGSDLNYTYLALQAYWISLSIYTSEQSDVSHTNKLLAEGRPTLSLGRCIRETWRNQASAWHQLRHELTEDVNAGVC